MTVQQDRVRRVREVLAATGGWNARSRSALVAWARAEGLSESELARTLEEALGLHVAPPRPGPASAPSPTASSEPGRWRWVVTAVAVVGLAFSIALGRLLLERVARAPARTERASTVVPRDAEPSRTLPPPPVSFPKPPELSGPRPVTAPLAVVEALGDRPQGPLDKAQLQAWREVFAGLAVNWTSMPIERRGPVRVSLAQWLAGAASPEELRTMRSLMERSIAEQSDPRQIVLAQAMQAMLLAEAGASERLSPAAAGDGAFSSGVRRSADEALEVWASAEIPALVESMGGSEARPRWTAWLESVRSLERPAARAALALAAIDGLLRSDARLDSQGLGADAIGSLVRALPTEPSLNGFQEVIDRMVAWLTDPRIGSERLWAFGGIWRSVAKLPDDRLLVAERDSMSARKQLAERWASLGASAVRPAWTELVEALRQPMPAPSAPLSRRLDALSDRLTLLRRIDAVSNRRDPSQVAPIPAPEAPSLRDAESAGEARWTQQLLAPRADVRMRALQSMRSADLAALVPADCAALAIRALSSASADERQLAQQVIRDSLAGSNAMRLAIARELATTADPRLALDLLQDIAGYDLPTDDVAALRADALGALLASMPPGEALESVASSLGRLDAECALWSGASLPGEAGALAWQAAVRLGNAVRSLRPVPPFDAAVSGFEPRSRRLQRLASTGPRAFASALAVIADLEAARLSVQRPVEQPALEAFVAAVSAGRARSEDSIEQAGRSLEAIAWCRLAALGAPLPVQGKSASAGTSDAAAGFAALVRAEAAASAADGAALRQRLRDAVSLNPELASSAALLMARQTAEPAQRRCWLERAQALGAAVPEAVSTSRAATIALAQLLAAAERQQTDRVVAPKPGAPGRADLERFAHTQGLSVDALLQCLRTPNDPARVARIDSLREAVLHQLAPGARPWLGALAAGDAESTPEADAAQPARLLPQLD